MKILFASHSFKGTMDCEKIGELLNAAVSKVFPDAITGYISFLFALILIILTGLFYETFR